MCSDSAVAVGCTGVIECSAIIAGTPPGGPKDLSGARQLDEGFGIARPTKYSNLSREALLSLSIGAPLTSLFHKLGGYSHERCLGQSMVTKLSRGLAVFTAGHSQ